MGLGMRGAQATAQAAGKSLTRALWPLRCPDQLSVTSACDTCTDPQATGSGLATLSREVSPPGRGRHCPSHLLPLPGRHEGWAGPRAALQSPDTGRVPLLWVLMLILVNFVLLSKGPAVLRTRCNAEKSPRVPAGPVLLSAPDPGSWLLRALGRVGLGRRHWAGQEELCQCTSGQRALAAAPPPCCSR